MTAGADPGVVWGADPEALDGLSQEFRTAGRRLGDVRARVRARLHHSPWAGRDADDFRSDWESALGHRLVSAAQALEAAADLLRRHAAEQRSASAASGGSVGSAGVGATTGGTASVGVDRDKVDRIREVFVRALDTGGWGVTRSDLDKIFRAVQEGGLNPEEKAVLLASLTPAQLAVLRDQMQESRLKGGWTHARQSEFLRLFADSPEAMRTLVGSDYPTKSWESSGPIDIQGAGGAALYGLQRDLAGQTQSNEITIIRGDDGTYVVHLPGVTDLSSGLRDGVVSGALSGSPLGGAAHAFYEWNGSNSADSPRDMRWGGEASRAGDVRQGGSWQNPYAAAVRLALQDAGVPPGATVMLTGHSFGAYTAMELAADRTFNNTDGSGYRVSSVIAMAADTDWRMDDDLPSHTSGLVLNNGNDAVYRAEAGLRRNPVESSVSSSWHEEIFSGGLKDAGHGLNNYAAWIEQNPDKLPPGFSQVTTGTVMQYQLHDIYR